jgi:hypothetical protein
VARRYGAGQSSSASAYTSGGGAPAGAPATNNTIDKFPFSSDGNATDVGDLSVARFYTAGQTSSANGYTSSGSDPGLSPGNKNIIDKFPFASDSNATDVGDVTLARLGPAGQSSTVSGYTSGGNTTLGAVNTIDKFPFASDGNATDVGDLTITTYYNTGQSSTASGYNSAGWNESSLSNVIEKFPFASDANSTDVGDLTVSRFGPAGQQY